MPIESFKREEEAFLSPCLMSPDDHTLALVMWRCKDDDLYETICRQVESTVEIVVGPCAENRRRLEGRAHEP